MRQDNVPGFPGYYISKSGRVYWYCTLDYWY